MAHPVGSALTKIKTDQTGGFDFGRATRAIHELMKSRIYCNLAKKSNYF